MNIPGTTFAIPDVHGRADLLSIAYGKIVEYPVKPFSRKTVVFLGDYVDRGSHSQTVIRFLMSRAPAEQFMHHVILKGNHEELMVNALWYGRNYNLWLANGGTQTLLSYNAAVNPYELVDNPVPKSHLDFLKGLPLFHKDAHRVYVHARVDNRAPLESQPSDILLWGMYASDEHGGWRGKHVVHGHHQHEFGPIRRADRTNLDCGAFYSGRLCVGVFDDQTPGGPVETIDVTIP